VVIIISWRYILHCYCCAKDHATDDGTWPKVAIGFKVLMDIHFISHDFSLQSGYLRHQHLEGSIANRNRRLGNRHVAGSTTNPLRKHGRLRARWVYIHSYNPAAHALIPLFSHSGPSTATPEASTAPTPTCAKCFTPETSSDSDNPSLKPCIACKSVLYCSRDCKKADTKTHKKVCAKLAQEYMKTADVKMASRQIPKESHRGGLQKWQFDT
jgi:hypothetical protein